MSDSSDTQPETHRQEKGGFEGAGASNDEYGALIEFIREQKRSGGGDDEEGDGSRTVKKRSFWAPWKTREVRVNKDGEEETVAAKVPASW